MKKILSLKSDAFAALADWGFEKFHAENHEVENLEIAPLNVNKTSMEFYILNLPLRQGKVLLIFVLNKK